MRRSAPQPATAKTPRGGNCLVVSWDLSVLGFVQRLEFGMLAEEGRKGLSYDDCDDDKEES